MKVSRFAAVLVSIIVVALLTVVAGLAAPAPQKGGPGEPPVVSDMTIIVGNETHHDTSLPLRDIPPLPVTGGKGEVEANENPKIVGLQDLEQHTDPVVQDGFVLEAMPSPTLTFDGIAYPGVNCNCAPPDPNADVGPNHIVETVNTGFQIWSKAGTSLYGPASINTLWSGFGGPCQTSNDGDPIVLYDQLANRWLISQFTASSPYNECIAISQTADPTGAWYRYAFQLSTSDFPDYPKFGVWPDGYYMSENWFVNASSYGGPRPYVFDRNRMLQGLSATFQTTSGALGSSVAPIIPADVDGATAPPAGAPNVFVGTPSTGGTLPLYKFHVDWTTPANTTWTSVNVAGAAYTEICPISRSCVPQAGTTARLDAIGDRMMVRAAYRNFGTYESIVTNMTVSSGGVAAIRWYEFRNLSGTPSIYQQGTFQPDTTWRWMGSAAQDKQGNIAVGYSASSSSINPQIRYAGRLVTDPLNQLTQGEATLYAGTGSQTATHSRWGDYSSMSVDPADDCTFWYTQEYFTTAWRTRIGSFKFPGCTSGPLPTPTNTPVGPTATNTPVPPTATNTPVPANNDDFGGAVNITVLPFTGTANTTNYTTAADDPALCAGTPTTGGHSAWYRYTPSANQTLNLDTLTSNYDTILAIFTGSRGALTRLACNDDASGTTSAISNFAVTAGTTYYIEVASYGTGAGGSLVLHVSAVGAPTATNTPVPPTATNTPVPPTATNTPVPGNNDDFGNAVAVSALPFAGTANTTNYTTAADDPALCAGAPTTGGHSAWYRYTPSVNQTLNLDTLTSNYDTILAIFTGSRGALTRLACNDDASGTTSAISNFAAGAGTTYYIEVASYGTGAGGSLVLHISAVGSPTATSTPQPPTATATPGTCPNLSGTYCRTDNEARTWIAGSTNQAITGDDQVKAVTLPFTFRFMGTNYTSINVSSNGNAHFGTASSAYSNVTIPSTSAPNAMIAAFWDDLNPAAGGGIYTGVSGTSPNRIFVIEWRGVPHYGTTDGGTFEIQLVETTNHIWILYQDTIIGSSSYNSGLSATSGVENAGGTAGNRYSYNTAVLTNGKVLHFWPQ